MLSDIARQRAGPLQCSRNIICLRWEAFQRNKGSVTQQLPQEESCLSWGATVCMPALPGLHITAPVQLPFALCHSARFFQEVGGWVCSHIEAYLLHCLSEETNCFLASFARTLPKGCPIHSQMPPSGKDWLQVELGKSLFVQSLTNILCQNRCDNGLLFPVP